jgi:CrcB protein
MKAVFAVFIGGLLGSAARIALDAAIPHTDTAFPVSTLLINIVGSFALGTLVTGVWPVAPAWLRAALGPGVLGSFTTFSAVAVSLVTLADGGRLLTAAAYLAATLALGFAGAAAGLALGARITPAAHTPRPSPSEGTP